MISRRKVEGKVLTAPSGAPRSLRGQRTQGTVGGLRTQGPPVGESAERWRGDRGLTHTRWAGQGAQPPPKGLRKETPSLGAQIPLCDPLKVPEKESDCMENSAAYTVRA